ncbi:hypothetical protein GW766_03270 [Candidatus Parcubacteria bacterium]|nr:hypothetical protein [Candidatus Parcubacteria bacterium]
MNETTPQSRLVALLALDTWSDTERNIFLEKSGQLILDAAVARLLLVLSEAELAKLELYLDSHKNIKDIIGYLSDTHPQFVDILGEEAVALQAEAEQIVSPL